MGNGYTANIVSTYTVKIVWIHNVYSYKSNCILNVMSISSHTGLCLLQSCDSHKYRIHFKLPASALMLMTCINIRWINSTRLSPAVWDVCVPLHLILPFYLCAGKHPVSALIELCNKRRIMQPDFVMVHHSGPDHRKNFLFKVSVMLLLKSPFDQITVLIHMLFLFIVSSDG